MKILYGATTVLSQVGPARAHFSHSPTGTPSQPATAVLHRDRRSLGNGGVQAFYGYSTTLERYFSGDCRLCLIFGGSERLLCGWPGLRSPSILDI